MKKIFNHRNSSTHNYAIVKGDIFESSLNAVNSSQNGCTVIIPNICNNMGYCRSILSSEIEKRFPEVAINLNLGGKMKLGHTQLVTVYQNKITKNSLVIANMICQNAKPSIKNRRTLHYPSLIKCMYHINDLCDTIIRSDSRVEIYCTKFGTGLAGGNWDFIAEIIDDMWSPYKIMVFV
jgi:hypothetical protein